MHEAGTDEWAFLARRQARRANPRSWAITAARWMLGSFAGSA